MNLKNLVILQFLLSFVYVPSFSQIQRVYVETYYVSDSLDATDTTGGFLEAGSKTYRVFIDLAPGSKVKKIYGDANHTLKFSSSEIFFNNISEGQTYAKDISKTRLAENTVALDTWLTIGLVTKPSSKVMGVPKSADDDGSFVGGINNDGGSAGITGGLLTNTDPAAGIPITTSDGNDTLTIPTGSWFDYGILSSNSDDSTIFGSLVQGKDFECNNCGLQYSGISGVDPDSNYVLVAQLTTKGELSFELNLELMDSTGAVVKYVANDSILLPGEIVNRYLKYPFEALCGCPDSNYLEYLADRDCNSLDSCIHLIVFGCMDPMSCNYNPDANVNIPSLCCDPGKCNDRDLALVCPELISNRNGEFQIYPNPVKDNLSITPSGFSGVITYIIYNSVGQIIAEKSNVDAEEYFSINTSDFNKGIYFIRILDANDSEVKSFTKE